MYVILILLTAAMTACLLCWIMILIDAFHDRIWKGVLCLCTPYILYYALFRFEHGYKRWILLGAFGSGAITALVLPTAVS